MLRQSIYDWRSHITDTYLFFRDSPRAVLCTDVWSQESSEDDEEEEDNNQYILDELSVGTEDSRIPGHQLEARFPKLGMTDKGGMLEFLSYNAERQFRKSLSSRVTASSPIVTDFTQAFNRARGIQVARGLSAPKINQIISGGYTPLDEAVSKLVEGELSGVALSRNYGVTLSPGYDYPSLVYGESFVGLVRDKPTLFGEFSMLLESLEEELGSEVDVYE